MANHAMADVIRSFVAVLILAISAFSQPRLDVIEFSSSVLRDNPLGDPALRKAAVLAPSQAVTNRNLPVVYYLPGFGGSSADVISKPEPWLKFIQKLADDGVPVIFVVVDARTRWVCSQYINSPAQGNYADYICDEIVPRVEARYPAPNHPPRRIVAGHSSGGFGALRLGLMHPEMFDGIIALSPDSDFPVTHLPLVKLAGVTNISLRAVQAIMESPPGTPLPKDGDLVYALALSAAYAPVGRRHPGEFRWLYDAKGHFRPEIWNKWLDNDPLTIVKKHPGAFRSGQSVYLEGAAQDEYKANIGARAIYEVIRNGPARVAFYEPPGHHSSHLHERIERGLEWILGGTTTDIQ